MLDALTPAARHAALILICTILTAVSVQLDAFNLPPVWDAAIGAVVTLGLAWFTPLVKQYGRCSQPDADDPIEETSEVIEP